MRRLGLCIGALLLIGCTAASSSADSDSSITLERVGPLPVGR